MNYTPPPAWMDEDPPCRGLQRVMFAGDKGDGTQKAKDICQTCPHTVKCLAFAVDNALDFGVWGGVGPRTRRLMRRAPGAPPRDASRCGTLGGWTAHRRRNEGPCDDCREAHNGHARRYRAERRAARNAAPETSTGLHTRPAWVPYA